MLKIDRRMYIITTIRYIKHVGYGRGLSVRYKNIDKRNCCCKIVNVMKTFTFVMQKCTSMFIYLDLRFHTPTFEKKTTNRDLSPCTCKQKL